MRDGKERQRKQRERHDAGESEHFAAAGRPEEAGERERMRTRVKTSLEGSRRALCSFYCALGPSIARRISNAFEEHACQRRGGGLGAVARRAPERSGGH